jgi:hypothetical protein
MSGRGVFRELWQPVAAALSITAWLIVTLWLGTKACFRGAWLLRRMPQLLSRTLRCPRGHTLAGYGVFTCGACRGQFEGHLFSRCPGCGALASHIPCPRCGLSVQDPLL